MSSGVDSGGIVAAAVMLPVGVAFGAGWLAWQGGKLLIEANKSVNKQIAEKKRQIEEATMKRKRIAIAAHCQLVDMCSQLLSQIENNSVSMSVASFSEVERLKVELNNICEEFVPDDVVQIESLTSIGFLKLEKIVAQQKHLSNIEFSQDTMSLYRGLSLADLMDDMRIAISKMHVNSTIGKDIRIADPLVIERAKLDEKLNNITMKIMEALEYVTELSNSGNLLISNSVWLHSCFDGIDEQIQKLYMPSVSNQELKRGIKRLESLYEQYEMLIPSIESNQKKFYVLYQVYVDACKALCEPILSVKSFKTVESLESSLLSLKRRAEKAQECAEIYNKLGPANYICYAWDQELRALGYSVHSRNDIIDMAHYKPKHAKKGETKLPFYVWDSEDLTQLYSITSDCSLQVIVHEDGTVSMKTISDADKDAIQVKQAQENHCKLLRKLHENLKKNWFVVYDYQETDSPDKITSFANWFDSDISSWKSDRTSVVIDERKTEKKQNQAKQSQ